MMVIAIIFGVAGCIAALGAMCTWPLVIGDWFALRQSRKDGDAAGIVRWTAWLHDQLIGASTATIVAAVGFIVYGVALAGAI